MLAKFNINRSRPLNFISLVRNYCHDPHSNDGDAKKVQNQKKPVDEAKREEAQKKMKELLQSLSKSSHISTEPVKLSRPPKQSRKTISKMKEPSSVDIIDFKMKKAVKKVAESLEGDSKVTESDLLSALRTQSSSNQNLNDIVSGMKLIQREKASDDLTPRDVNFRSDDFPKSKLHLYRSPSREGDRPTSYKNEKPIDLFGLPPIGIFPADSTTWTTSGDSELSTWSSAVEREKSIASNHAPRNYFEEQIKWTEEGQLWTFPVDNEMGLEEEKSVSFADHVFLERHLQGWCPNKGPIRHFMELVCVGLSKNPWVPAERKRDHIFWYKDYFESKRDLLKDVGAM